MLLILILEAIYLLQNSVKGLNDYLQVPTRTSQMLVSKQLMITLCNIQLSQPEPYWNSKLTYSVTWPVNEDFLKSKGKRLW